VKTNVDFNSPQEDGIFRPKERKKENENKNENNSRFNNTNRIIEENDEKNKEDKNINDDKNNNVIIEKKDAEFKENKIISNNINDVIKNVIEEEKNEDDPLITYITSNRKISEEEIKNSSKLIIEEIDGTLLNGKIIEINAGGMVDGRNKKDGFTIFGQKKNVKTKKISFLKDINNNENNGINENNNNTNDNDIFIPDIEINYSKYLGYPYIFAIYYKIEDKSYYIRAYCGKESDNKILFIKLNNENKYLLKRKELISAGNIIFQVNALENCLEIINLTNKKYSNYRRVFDGINKKIVTIGRHKDCDFFFAKDKSFSRYQTTFEFDDNSKEWSVIDGKDNKGSTNGTWIFGTHSFIIKNEMIVEILNSKIKIKEIKKGDLEDKK
jgi:hypothetical protein